MGYRTYIASIPRREYDHIMHFTKEELCAYKKVDDGYVGVYDIATTKLYEFGKYTEFDNSKFFKPFFSDERLQSEMCSDSDFYVVEKDYLKHIIEHYNEKVKAFYKELLSGITEDNVNSIPQSKAAEFYNHIRSNSNEWLHLTPFDLDSGDEVSTSWKYEYSIFELVRIYKSFDWESNLMVYYGY